MGDQRMDKDADAGEPQRMLRPQELVFIQSSDLHCLGFEMHTLREEKEVWPYRDFLECSLWTLCSHHGKELRHSVSMDTCLRDRWSNGQDITCVLLRHGKSPDSPDERDIEKADTMQTRLESKSPDHSLWFLGSRPGWCGLHGILSYSESRSQ